MPHLRIHPRLRHPEPLARCDYRRCRGACCMSGVWVDVQRIAAILHHADTIRRWLPPDAADPALWFTPLEETDPFVPSKRVRHTRVLARPQHPLGEACVFWRPEDARCALQVAAEALGLHPWHFKPFYCILHPLDVDEHGYITLDDAQTLLHTPGGCVQPGPLRPPLETFAPELRYLLPSSSTPDTPARPRPLDKTTIPRR